jgi:HEAT repeat protein
MEALLAITLTLVATTVVLLLVLIVRRLLLARRERRHATAADWLLPVAIEFVAGDEPLPDGLSAYDQTVLAEQLRRYSQMLSGEATERIALYFRDSDALREARRGLHSRRAWRRADAAFALGDMGIDETTPDLLRALGDRKRIVRTAAARALGRLKAEEATVPLVEAFVDNRVPRGVAGDALLRMGPKIARQLRELAGSREIELQATALTLLGLVGAPATPTFRSRGCRIPLRTCGSRPLRRSDASARQTANPRSKTRSTTGCASSAPRQRRPSGRSVRVTPCRNCSTSRAQTSFVRRGRRHKPR